MQKVLQTGLSMGMSATAGIHNFRKPNPIANDPDAHKTIPPKDWTPTKDTRITYRGKHGDIHASPIIIGAWPWGDKSTFHWTPEELPAVKEAWKTCLENGINTIDTAQLYGSGESERICGDLFKGLPRDSFVIQTKYYVVPKAQTVLHPDTAPLRALQDSLERMGLEYVDVYIVHGHIHMQSVATVAKSMAECVNRGLAKTIGVANYSKEEMLHMKAELAKYGVPLACNQCEYSVLRRLPEIEGLITACEENGIVFQGYSSLGQGRLTGKYGEEKEPPNTYRFSNYKMQELRPVLEVLKGVAERRGVPMSAVALNYSLARGVSPLVGTRKLEQARENSQALGWRLSDEEVKMIDGVSLRGYATELWQHG